VCGYGVRWMPIRLQERLPLGHTYMAGDYMADRLDALKAVLGGGGAAAMALDYCNRRSWCP
ncbi:MAG: hypothetical protein JRN22_05035, partial [Nitrososphaerota archaeon]|nr:hypothetical protein [Nitrososphaerota archaeon]